MTLAWYDGDPEITKNEIAEPLISRLKAILVTQKFLTVYSSMYTLYLTILIATFVERPRIRILPFDW